MARVDVRGRGPSGARAVLTAAVAALVAALLAVGGVWASPAQAALPAGSTVNGVVGFYGVTVVPTPGGRRALDLLAAAAKGTPGVSVTVTGWAAAPRTTRAVLKLSSLRANYVVAQLRRRGVTANFTARAGGRYPVRGTAGRRADVTITTPAAPPTTPTSAPTTTPTSTPPTTPTSAPPTTPTSTPTTLPPAPTAVSISSSRTHTCAVMTDTTARCWGRNEVGQLGDNKASGFNSPVPVAVVDPDNTANPLTGVVSISAGYRYTCAVMEGDTARCWGANEDYGQLGNNATTDSSVPVPVVDQTGTQELGGVASISAGENHTCVVMRDYTARCWGLNDSGQLGDNQASPGNSPVPVPVVDPTGPTPVLSEVASISAGAGHTCAVMRDDTARCWGANSTGQLGDNQASGFYSSVPVKVVDPTDTTQALGGVARISAGSYHTCAVMRDDTARCWGLNVFGQLGNRNAPENSLVPADSSVPVVVVDPGDTTQALSGVVSISAGDLHTCAVMRGDTARCWGYNDVGQLGNNNATNNSSVPVKVVDPGDTTQTLSGVAGISAGFNHTCAVMAAGTARCWGSNNLGKLGNNDAANDSPVPVVVVGIP